MVGIESLRKNRQTAETDLAFMVKKLRDLVTPPDTEDGGVTAGDGKLHVL